ncbi:MAG: site-specific integrase [Xanthomonadaceae bacterium]|nr:site-specific integrase [Xanthomonadaceae bacterium]
MRIVSIIHPAGHEMPMLVDKDGLPIPDANEWLFGRRSQAPTTQSRVLSELVPLCRWAEDNAIDVRQRIEGGQGFTEAEIISGLVETLRLNFNSKDAKKRVSNSVFNLRLATCNAYLKWMCNECIARLASDDRRVDRIVAIKGLVHDWLTQSATAQPVSQNPSAKALTADQQSALAELLHPKIRGLGGTLAAKYRNFVAIMLMLLCGLRRGELLSLRVEDVTFGAIPSIQVRRRSPDPDDKRRPRPRVKRLPRTLALDPFLAHFINDYVMVHREVLLERSKTDTPYLIVSDEGDPLSISRIYALCVELRRKLKGVVPDNFSPHSLRHSFSESMEQALRNAGLDESRRAQALALLRGDTSLDSQNVYIEREIRERANLVLSKYQGSLVSQVEQNQIPF